MVSARRLAWVETPSTIHPAAFSRLVICSRISSFAIERQPGPHTTWSMWTTGSFNASPSLRLKVVLPEPALPVTKIRCTDLPLTVRGVSIAFFHNRILLMNTHIKWILLMGTMLGASGAHAARGLWVYSGQFSTPTLTGTSCPDGLFDTTNDVIAQFGLFGPTQRTAVAQFKTKNTGALDNRNLTGNLGGEGDIELHDQFSLSNQSYDVGAEGYVSPEMLAVTVTIDILDSQGNNVCHAEADYSGTVTSR